MLDLPAFPAIYAGMSDAQAAADVIVVTESAIDVLGQASQLLHSASAAGLPVDLTALASADAQLAHLDSWFLGTMLPQLQQFLV